jgi:hypothetical protein
MIASVNEEPHHLAALRFRAIVTARFATSKSTPWWARYAATVNSNALALPSSSLTSRRRSLNTLCVEGEEVGLGRRRFGRS